MKGMVLDATWEPKPDYQVSEWEQVTRKAITGNAIWRHPKLEVRDWPDPTPAPKEVLLEVQACGVCGSDMHFFETDDDNYILYPPLTHFPTILRHDLSAKARNLAVEGIKEGQRLVLVATTALLHHLRPETRVIDAPDRVRSVTVLAGRVVLVS